MADKQCPLCKTKMTHYLSGDASMNASGSMICGSSASARGGDYWMCENDRCKYISVDY